MNAPYRLVPVTVVLDAYHKSLLAVGHAVAVAAPIVKHVVRREARHLARLAGPSRELMPSLISQRLRAAKR
ncbi:MAG: hypothetical protein M3478_06535 [Planctomycetota bacterium]|nr:hypothetical protein [Planctomycetota bacterium]